MQRKMAVIATAIFYACRNMHVVKRGIAAASIVVWQLRCLLIRAQANYGSLVEETRLPTLFKACVKTGACV